jgi:hypothetical protein
MATIGTDFRTKLLNIHDTGGNFTLPHALYKPLFKMVEYRAFGPLTYLPCRRRSANLGHGRTGALPPQYFRQFVLQRLVFFPLTERFHAVFIFSRVVITLCSAYAVPKISNRITPQVPMVHYWCMTSRTRGPLNN